MESALNQCCVLGQLIACGVAVATYNDGATDFRDTPAYKESQTQEFPEESESSSADVFEGNLNGSSTTALE